MNIAHQADFPEGLASLIATLVTQFVGQYPQNYLSKSHLHVGTV